MRQVVRFHLQPTVSFPDGAPQREVFDTDEFFDLACAEYADEWRAKYKCGDRKCENRDCPEHFPDRTIMP